MLYLSSLGKCRFAFPRSNIGLLATDPVRARNLVDLRSGASEDSATYIESPFPSRQEYADVMMAIATCYPELMTSRGKSERPLLQVLRYACSYRHYSYLQNGSIFASLQTGLVRELMPTGTTATIGSRITSPARYIFRAAFILGYFVGFFLVIRIPEIVNEALHRELRYWAERIVAQHEEKLELSRAVFPLHKLMTHVAASQRTGTRQMDQSFLSHALSGFVGDSFFAPTDSSEQDESDSSQEKSHPKSSVVIITSGKKKKTIQNRKKMTDKDKDQKLTAISSQGKPRVLKPMEKKRTVFTTVRRKGKLRK